MRDIKSTLFLSTKIYYRLIICLTFASNKLGYFIFSSLNNLLRKNASIVFLLLLSAYPVAAADVVIVQSGPLKPYNEAIEGIISILRNEGPTQGPKSLRVFQIEKILLDDSTDEESRRRQILKHRPAVIIAVGTKALKVSAPLRHIPLIYLITPRPDPLIGGREMVSGISMIVPPLSSLRKLHKHFPHIRRLTVLYHPQYSRSFIEEARKAADLFRYELNEIQVLSIKNVPAILAALDDTIEALWMIPDPNVVSSQTVPAFLNYSFRNNILLLTFAEKYLELGATFAVVPNTFLMGQSAALLAQDILNNKESHYPSIIRPMAFHAFKNENILAKMADLKNNTGRSLP